MFDVSDGIDGPSWQDNEGWAPLHLSVVAVTRAPRERCWMQINGVATMKQKWYRKHVSKSSAVLALAVKADLSTLFSFLWMPA